MTLYRLAALALAGLMAACQSSPKTEEAGSVSSTPPDASAVDSSRYKGLMPAHWLVGSWEMKDPAGIVEETWHLRDDSTLAARVVMHKTNGDSVLQETIELRHRGGAFVYEPTVLGQNEDKPVAFSVVRLLPGRFVAENLAHDFPRRIIYQNQGDTALRAALEGDSAAQRMELVMYRKPHFR